MMKAQIGNLLLVAVVTGISLSFTSMPVTDVNPAGGAYLVFAGRSGGNIKMSELRGQTELSVEGCARGSKIFSFSLEINDGGRMQTLSATSNKLTSVMISALNRLEPGDSFVFKSMKAQLPNGKDVVDVYGEKFVVVKEEGKV